MSWLRPTKVRAHLLSHHRNEYAFSELLHSGEHLLLGDLGGKPRQEQGRVGRYEAQEARLDPGDAELYTDTRKQTTQRK